MGIRSGDRVGQEMFFVKRYASSDPPVREIIVQPLTKTLCPVRWNTVLHEEEIRSISQKAEIWMEFVPQQSQIFIRINVSFNEEGPMIPVLSMATQTLPLGELMDFSIVQ